MLGCHKGSLCVGEPVKHTCPTAEWLVRCQDTRSGCRQLHEVNEQGTSFVGTRHQLSKEAVRLCTRCGQHHSTATCETTRTPPVMINGELTPVGKALFHCIGHGRLDVSRDALKVDTILMQHKVTDDHFFATMGLPRPSKHHSYVSLVCPGCWTALHWKNKSLSTFSHRCDSPVKLVYTELCDTSAQLPLVFEEAWKLSQKSKLP